MRAQGRPIDERELLDAELVAGHLVEPGSVSTLFAEHRRVLFPTEMFADLFASGRGPPSKDVVSTWELDEAAARTVALLALIAGQDVQPAVRRKDLIWGVSAMLSGFGADAAPMSRTEVLTDEMWAQVGPLLPPLKGRMGRPRAPYRPLMEGAIYRLRTGVAWRDLPAEFGPWQTVWKRQYEFCNDGTWTRC